MRFCSGFLYNFLQKNPLVLAPMSGVSDLPFRKLVSGFSDCLVFSEMIASRAMILKTRQSMQKAAFDSESFAIRAVQIAGCEPKVMAEAAKLNEDLGADIIDINFGCPVKKVINGFAGSALMKNEELAEQILQAVVNAVKLPVTLKMRMGWDFNNLNAPKLAKIAQDVGIKMITVHGRTRNQLFSGQADWQFVKKVKAAVFIPVIVNGDIKNFDDVKNALEQSGADGAMIGRGCYGRPWCIKSIDDRLKTNKTFEPSAQQKKELIFQHLELMLENYEKESGLKMFRKHLAWYSSGMTDSALFRQRIMQIEDIAVMKREINSFF